MRLPVTSTDEKSETRKRKNETRKRKRKRKRKSELRKSETRPGTWSEAAVHDEMENETESEWWCGWHVWCGVCVLWAAPVRLLSSVWRRPLFVR